jgi:hypothetical protein
MSPLIEATGITAAVGVAGVIGTVWVARATSRNARILNRETIEGERSQRLWEKQAAAYEEALNETLQRGVQREAALSRGDIGSGPPKLKRIRLRSEESEAIRVKAVLLAYASPAVRQAYEAAEQTSVTVEMAAAELYSVNAALMRAHEREASGESDGHPEPLPSYEDALAALHESKADALAADEKLIAAINRELSWAPRELSRS